MRKWGVSVIVLWLLLGQMAGSGISRAEESGKGNIVYVAGASDCFPVEFFDHQEKRYKGMIPLLLEKMNEQGVYRFVYLQPGKKDRRTELAQKNQVDMYLGFDLDGFPGTLKGEPFWEGASDREKGIFFCYTDAADEKLYRYVEEYAAGLSQEELRELVMEGSRELPGIPLQEDMAKVILGAGMAGLLFCAVLLLLKVKREKAVARAYRFQDTLTGFGSIDKWKVVFKQLVHDENRSKYCVVYMDLGMKSVFKTYGFEETAQMLEAISEVLERELDQVSAFARFYEVGFVMLLPYYSREQLEGKLEELKDGIARMVKEKQKDYILTPYFGVYLLKQDDKSMEQPIYYAETTSEYARQKDQLYAVYDAQVKTLTIESYELERDAVKALARGELEMYIQPVVRVSDKKIVGGETFVRWEHPQRGLLHPDVFLPVFKRNRMMDRLDLYMFEKACQFQRRRMETGQEPLGLRCNFSGWNLFQPDFADKLIEKITQYDVPGGCFAIRIVQAKLSWTNKTLRGNIKKTIEALQSHGFEIYMGELNINAVFEEFLESGISKLVLDRELIGNMNECNRTVMQSIVDMGHRIGTTIIAEGVESREQESFLKEAGCDFAQGFYYYQVISAEEFSELLKVRQ